MQISVAYSSGSLRYYHRHRHSHSRCAVFALFSNFLLFRLKLKNSTQYYLTAPRLKQIQLVRLAVIFVMCRRQSSAMRHPRQTGQTRLTDLYTQLCDKLSTFSATANGMSFVFSACPHLFFFFFLPVTRPNMPVGPFGRTYLNFLLRAWWLYHKLHLRKGISSPNWLADAQIFTKI